MRSGLVVPYADSRAFADLAALAEANGWDGIFTWEAVFGVDAWVSLAAAAMQTESIRLGTLLTPVSRYKPWDLASRVGSVDRLSGGRAILSAGLGALHDGWTAFEENEGRAVRAQKVEECLAIYAGLMAGQPFEFEGRHHRARPTTFMLPDPPVQQPHPPVWVVGALVLGQDPQPSLARAARWNGLLPQVVDRRSIHGAASDPGPADPPQSPIDPAVLAGMVDRIAELRAQAGLGMAGYDVIVEGDITGGFMSAEVFGPGDYEGTGATWWIESWWDLEHGDAGVAELRRRIVQGPPV